VNAHSCCFFNRSITCSVPLSCFTRLFHLFILGVRFCTVHANAISTSTGRVLQHAASHSQTTRREINFAAGSGNFFADVNFETFFALTQGTGFECPDHDVGEKISCVGCGVVFCRCEREVFFPYRKFQTFFAHTHGTGFECPDHDVGEKFPV